MAVRGKRGAAPEDYTVKPIKKIGDLTPDPHNANKGTKRGLELLEHSLQQLGAGRSILVDRQGLVIAGNKTLERAADLGLELEVIRTDGRKLVVVQREDLDLQSTTDARARELALADNRIAQVDLDWDADVLLNRMYGVDLSEYFFDNELEKLTKGAAAADVEHAGPTHTVNVSHTCPNCGHSW